MKMRYLYDAIPDLQGCICTGLVRQEYWFEGQLSEDANVFYLQVDHGLWHRFLIDGGVVFWKIVNSLDERDTAVSDQYHYPQIEIANQTGLFGRRVEAIIPIGQSQAQVSELQVHFSGGRTLVLYNADDHSTFAIVTDASLGAA
jgi:hypothetical protein